MQMWYDKNVKDSIFIIIFNVFFLYLYRFFETASIIEQNLSLFASLCKHIDIVTALVEYLNYYGAQFMFNEEYGMCDNINLCNCKI